MIEFLFADQTYLSCSLYANLLSIVEFSSLTLLRKSWDLRAHSSDSSRRLSECEYVIAEFVGLHLTLT